MWRTTIVVWLVLLVLALTVVAFVTRIAEKYRLAHRLSKSSETTSSMLQSEQPAILQHQQTQATHRWGLLL
jgi:sensor domain CHASE-containing protein